MDEVFGEIRSLPLLQRRQGLGKGQMAEDTDLYSFGMQSAKASVKDDYVICSSEEE